MEIGYRLDRRLMDRSRGAEASMKHIDSTNNGAPERARHCFNLTIAIQFVSRERRLHSTKRMLICPLAGTARGINPQRGNRASCR